MKPDDIQEEDRDNQLAFDMGNCVCVTLVLMGLLLILSAVVIFI